MKNIIALLGCLILLGCSGHNQQQIKQEYQQIAKVMDIMDFGEDMPTSEDGLSAVEQELNALDLTTNEMQEFRQQLQFRFYYQRKIIEMEAYMDKPDMSAEEEKIHEGMMRYLTDITPQLSEVLILADDMEDKYGTEK